VSKKERKKWEGGERGLISNLREREGECAELWRCERELLCVVLVVLRRKPFQGKFRGSAVGMALSAASGNSLPHQFPKAPFSDLEKKQNQNEKKEKRENLGKCFVS
jgi:hypothetical protein